MGRGKGRREEGWEGCLTVDDREEAPRSSSERKGEGGRRKRRVFISFVFV